MGDRPISVGELRQHKTIPNKVWIVIDSIVWDITSFLPEHPGGPNIIYKYAGRDASQAYNEIHAVELISKTLGSSKRIGVLDMLTVDEEWQNQSKSLPTSRSSSTKSTKLPPLQTIISIHDFESLASKHLTPKAWAFYSSAATDLITMRANRSLLDQIWFRPRGLIDVSTINTRSKILGIDVDIPLFIAPAAFAKLAHPEGEKALARAAATKGIVQCISTNASFSVKEIVETAPAGTPFFFQLYVNRERQKSAELLKQCEELGVRAIFLTIDAVDPGKREADERSRVEAGVQVPMTGASTRIDAKGAGLARTTGSFIDNAVTWDDIKWIRSCTSLPLVLKGVQGASDARRAMEHGCEGILVSNHGGRCLDGSPPAIVTLLEIHKLCPEVFEKMEVYLDGGIARGTDIIKALSLGVTAVSIGRPFLYSLLYNEDGAMHLVDILKEELISSMKTVGITDIKDAHPGLVNTLGIDYLASSTEGHPYIRWKPKAKM